MKKKVEIITTADGSHTIYSPKYDSTYHSMHGAIQESDHIFIQNGLKHYHKKAQKEVINLLEIGFGSGLNAFMSLYSIQEEKIKINYIALEKHPLPEEIIAKLNYPEKISFPNSREIFTSLHEKSDKAKLINDQFSIWVKNIDFHEMDLSEAFFDIIYFDPFDPGVEIQLWETGFLLPLKKALRSNGILITYGAKGSFKRALKSLDFQVESIPGPPGKREITRATKG